MPAPPADGDPALPKATPETEAALGGAVAVAPPVGWSYGGGNPVGAFLRINDTLDRLPGPQTPRPGVQGQATTPDIPTDAGPRAKAATASVLGRYVGDNPRQWIGRPSVGTGECVPLVQAATGAPRSPEWHPGALVQGNRNIRPGTAIAIFDSNGHYTGHTAIYLGQDEHGIRVIDQWNIRDREGRITGKQVPHERTIRFGNSDGDVVDRGEYYRVVE